MRRILALIAVMALLNLAASGCRHVAGACDCEHAGPQNRVDGSCKMDGCGSATYGAAAAPSAPPTVLGAYAPPPASMPR